MWRQWVCVVSNTIYMSIRSANTNNNTDPREKERNEISLAFGISSPLEGGSHDRLFQTQPVQPNTIGYDEQIQLISSMLLH